MPSFPLTALPLYKPHFLCYLLVMAVSLFPQQYYVFVECAEAALSWHCLPGQGRCDASLPAAAVQTFLLSCSSCNGLSAAGQEGPVCCLLVRLGVRTPGWGEPLPPAVAKDAASQQHVAQVPSVGCHTESREV